MSAITHKLMSCRFPVILTFQGTLAFQGTLGKRPPFTGLSALENLRRFNSSSRGPTNRYTATSLLDGLPYQDIHGKIPKDEYVSQSLNIDKASQRYLQTKGLTPSKMEEVNKASLDPAIPFSKKMTTTMNWATWRSIPPTPIKITKNCALISQTSDKEVLVKQVATLTSQGHIDIGKKIFLIVEGSDNGDFLGFLVPWLCSLGVEAKNIRVIMTNGNNSKLAIAAEFAKQLGCPGQHLICNAFDGISKVIEEELVQKPDFQRIFLPFRLVIVENVEKISSLIETRLKAMRSSDIAVASFLCLDSLARTTMEDYHNFQAQPQDSSEVLQFTKNASAPLKRALLKKFPALSKENSLQLVNSAFTPNRVQEMITRLGGRMIYMSKILSTTDEGYPIYVLGTIFGRAISSK